MSDYIGRNNYWLAVTLAVIVAFFTFIVPWAQVVSYGHVNANLTPMDMSSAIGATYGPCSCPPWASLANASLQGMPFGALKDVALEAVVPALVSVTFLAVGAWLFPLAFFFALLSLLRWKAMIFSGVLFLA